MISVIIPIYNAEKYLAECIDSVIRQTYKELEIILVNDGSTDSSLNICNKYSAQDSRVRVITKENGGQMSAWIIGVNMSSGEYIAFVDSDDYIDSQMYEEMLSVAERENADIVMCGRAVFDRFGKVSSPLNLKPLYSGDDINLIYDIVFPDLGYCISQARWDKLFKRDIVVDNMNKYCGKCVRTMEDRFIVSSSLLSAKVFATIDKPFYNYRLVRNASSKKPRLELFDIAELLYSTQERMLKDKGLFEKYKQKLELTRLDYLRMIVIRNIGRRNGLSFRKKVDIAKGILCDSRYSETVLQNKDKCVGKFGRFIYWVYKIKSPVVMVFIAKMYCDFVETENKNGF